MADIHYHIERPGPRSRHILAHMLGRMAGWQAEEVADKETFAGVTGPKLIYGKDPVKGAFHAVPHGFLEQSGTGPTEPSVKELGGIPVLFPGEMGDLRADVFAATFFQLSRYEEYGGISRDAHDRPETASLHAARHGYLQRPVVDEWFLLLTDKWRELDPRLPAVKRSYSQTATMDVDNGAMYLGRSWWRTLGGIARDLLRGRPRRVADRLTVLAGTRSDPYTVHTAFLDLVERNGGRAIVNFITAPRGEHDHAIGPEQPFMRECMRATAARAEVGLHPGYGSSTEPSHLAKEKQLLERAVDKPVILSRQHFLRMQLPGTYRELERLGIREEHSMGLADRAGFRAGTCTPFPFYDLLAEEETALMVHPFAVMDSALCYKMGLTPQEAAAEAMRMVDAVRRVQGTFISVWHERFLSDYGDEKGWGGLAEQVITYARP